MITCGGQATIPIVYAVSRWSRCPTPRSWPRSLSRRRGREPAPTSMSSPDHRARRGNHRRRRRGKAIIILNPAEPPMIMRDTVFCAIPEDADTRRDRRSPSREIVAEVQAYVPGYRLRSEPQFDDPPMTPAAGRVVTAFVEVEGAGRLPAAVRGQPRHHDRGGHQGRRGDRAAHSSDTASWQPAAITMTLQRHDLGHPDDRHVAARRLAPQAPPVHHGARSAPSWPRSTPPACRSSR